MAELVIGGVITSDVWMDGDVSSSSVRRWLAANTKAKEVVVRLNSPGGDAFEGVAIYNALKRHDAKIIVEVEGLAASAASVIAMAGEEVRVHQGAQIMIHEASSIAWGNAKDMRSTADRLEKINAEVAEIYVARTGKSADEVLKLMADETWMGGRDAVSLGFATSVIAAKAKPQQSARAQAMLSTYRRAPESVLARQVMTVRPSPLGELARATVRIGDR
jgi:ATP-dependent Clp protease protease subunit